MGGPVAAVPQSLPQPFPLAGGQRCDIIGVPPLIENILWSGLWPG